eukprot:TRINITY_DN915_c0_g1_i2.p1 TRINITY_DN915_c0_g1~~TRINITY_DN915_c0_g1_i2.p1  ORF type:complete len:218 (-),score=9.02 TRINITY_DN915_c0_g1_i2:115-768(-)
MSLKIALVAVLFVAFACGDTVIREEIDSVVPELAEQSDTTASGQMAEAPGETKATLVQEEQKSGDKLGRRGHGRGARRRSSLAQDEDTFGGRKPRRSYRRRSSLVQDEEKAGFYGRKRRVHRRRSFLVQEEQKSGDRLGRRGHGRGARRRSSLAQDEDTFGGRKPRRSYRRRSSLVQDEESSEDKVLWGRRRRRRVPAPPVQYRRRSPRNFDSQNGL